MFFRRLNRAAFSTFVDGKIVRCKDLMHHPDKTTNKRPATPVYIFMHICTKGPYWKAIVQDQLSQIIDAGLYDAAKTIYYGCTCDSCSVKLPELFSAYEKIKPLPKAIRDDKNTWENITVNEMIEHAIQIGSKEDANFLYIHSKGSTGKSKAQHSWRNYMMYWMVKQHEACRSILDAGYNTVGVMYNPQMFKGHKRHYSGNFFWTSARYLSTVPKITNIPNRYEAEMVLFTSYEKGKHVNMGTHGEFSIYFKTPFFTYTAGAYGEELPEDEMHIGMDKLKCRLV
jgi:hypothetical protein